MGIWDRRKRGGSPDPAATGTSPDPAATGTSPDPAATGTLPHSVGIEIRGGKFAPLIGKGVPLPASVTATFTTDVPYQSSITISCFQGEESLTARNTKLGSFELTDIPPGRPGESQIEVTFRVDASGAFSMTARDAGTGRDLPVLRW